MEMSTFHLLNDRGDSIAIIGIDGIFCPIWMPGSQLRTFATLCDFFSFFGVLLHLVVA